LACTWRGSSGSSSTSERQRPWIGHANDCHHLPRRTQRRAELQPFGHAASLLLRLTRSLASFSPRKAFSALSDSISRLRRECSGSGDPSLIQGHPSSSPGVWWCCRGSPSWPAFAHWSDEPAGFILSAGTSKIVTTTLPVGSARHRRGHGVAYRWPAGMPRVDSDEAASGAPCPTPHVPLRRPASSVLVLLVRPRRISAAVSLSFDVRAPLERRAMNERGSQRRADKWTV
jgi:hypothetical protein